MDTNDPTEVDPDDLQRQLADIKRAMELEEQYPGQRRLWLRYGGVIAVVSIVTQFCFLFVTEGPGTFYLGVWVAYTGITGLSLMRLAAGIPSDKKNSATLDWRILFVTLISATVLLGLQSGPVLSAASEGIAPSAFAPLNGAWAYSLVISVAGIGFLFAGNALQAYRIRKRDRLVFYGAGGWMLVFAVGFTNFPLLHRIGYGVFGFLFLIYSVGAYFLLDRSSDTT